MRSGGRSSRMMMLSRQPRPSVPITRSQNAFQKTIKDECLNHLVFFGERNLRYVMKDFMARYHRERFHQGLGGQLVDRPASATRTGGKVGCRSRLGGTLNCYHREAARGPATTFWTARGVPSCRTELGVARNLGRDERRGRMAKAM
jgi:hypothetical protein